MYSLGCRRHSRCSSLVFGPDVGKTLVPFGSRCKPCDCLSCCMRCLFLCLDSFLRLNLVRSVPSGGIAGVLVSQKRLLVYELAGCFNKEPLLPMGIEWAQATGGDNVADLFRDDPRRKKTFLDFIDKGYYGVILCHDTQWVSYGWMSKPGTLGPPHLPVGIQQAKCIGSSMHIRDRLIADAACINT